MRSRTIFICVSVVLCLLGRTVVYAGTEKNDAREEATACVETYFEALSAGDIETANKCFDGEDEQWRTKRLSLMKEFGMEEYDELEIEGYPVADGEEEWIFVVTYELRISGIEERLPGLEMLRAYREDGSWFLNWTFTIEGGLEEIWESAEIEEKVDVCNEKYAGVLAENKELAAWVEELQNAVSAKVSETLSEESAIEEENGSEAFSEEMTDGDAGKESGEQDSRKADIYVVQPGDSLWSIAKEQLGNGMCWMTLYDANRQVIGNNPNLILPGMELNVAAIGAED